MQLFVYFGNSYNLLSVVSFGNFWHLLTTFGICLQLLRTCCNFREFLLHLLANFIYFWPYPFSPQTKILVQFSSTQQRVNRDRTYFATKLRKLEQNRLCDKTGEKVKKKIFFKWRYFSTWQIFLHRHRLWCLWQISGMLLATIGNIWELWQFLATLISFWLHWGTVGNYYHVTMPPYHHVILSYCYPAILSSCHLVIMSSYHPIILSSCQSDSL